MKKQGLLLLLQLSLSFLLIQSIRFIDTKASTGHPASDLSAAVTVRAAGRGGPWVNLSDGRDVLTEYKEAADFMPAQGMDLATPLTLVSGDFDEDGVQDLLSGYLGPGGGILALHQGNADSIYSKDGDHSALPFASPARVFHLPEAPEFLATGDFDADGHLDVVATGVEDRALHLLAGDGRGNLGQAVPIELTGEVTALVAGEINRADGLTDLAVAIRGPGGPEVVIFEGPEGALKSKPESLALPSQATALAIGQLDEDYPADLAIAAGHDLLIMHGRDRKLTLEQIKRDEVSRAVISRRSFPFFITSIAVGDFTLDRSMDVAMLSDERALYLLAGAESQSRRRAALKNRELRKVAHLSQQASRQFTLTRARVSTLPQDDLLILDRANRQLQIFNQGLSEISNPKTNFSGDSKLASLDLESEPVAILPMRLNEDAFVDFAILKSSRDPLAVVLTAPASIFTVTNTGDSGTGSLRQAILNANSNPGADRIEFAIPGAGPHTITPTTVLPTISDPVTIAGNSQQGFSGVPVIELNGGSAGAGVDGLKITAGSSVVRNLVINRFSNTGIDLSSNGNNIIEGNYIGTNAAGTADMGNTFHGLTVQSSNNTIGGTTAAARNIISGNDNFGIFLTAGTTGNSVQGNFIGTNAAGTEAVGNSSGVATGGQSGTFANNTIGGTAPGARNIISGNNGLGVSISGTIVGNLVQGNFIGTNAAGSAALGNISDGVLINFGSLNNTIGGTTPAARNVISGNGRNGIRCDYHPNMIQGNFIGMQMNGVSPLGNGSNGVFLNFVGGNTVGGAATGAGNTIAFNGGDGVLVVTGTANAVSSNSIFSNTGLGINLELDGATPNDPCDNDSGGNNRQNFPVITSANSSGGSTTIQGTLDSLPDITYRIEFFSNSACVSGVSEGQNFIGSATATTNSNCGASFTITLPVAVPSGGFITATAIDPDANTSEFSQCFLVGTACSYSISPPSQSFSSRGGEGSVSVSTSGGCGWTAVSNASWIVITSADNGSGSGVVSYVVRENFSTASRTGTVSLAGQTFTVTQAGNCTFSISPTRKSFNANGGTGTVNVTVSGACTWTAVSNDSWITINSGASGTGQGAVTYTVASTTSSRTGTMTIAGQTFTVKQKKP